MQFFLYSVLDQKGLYVDASKPSVTPQVIKITDLCIFFFSLHDLLCPYTWGYNVWIKQTENVLKDALYEDEKENSHLSLTRLLLSPLLWLLHLELVLAILYSFSLTLFWADSSLRWTLISVIPKRSCLMLCWLLLEEVCWLYLKFETCVSYMYTSIKLSR